MYSGNFYRVRTDLPKNISVGLSFPYDKGKLRNYDLFIEKIDSLVNHVLSVLWLSEHLSERQDTTVEVRFITDRYMSPKAITYFVETMKALGADGLMAEVQGQLAESIFLQIDEGGG